MQCKIPYKFIVTDKIIEGAKQLIAKKRMLNRNII